MGDAPGPETTRLQLSSEPIEKLLSTSSMASAAPASGPLITVIDGWFLLVIRGDRLVVFPGLGENAVQA